MDKLDRKLRKIRVIKEREFNHLHEEYYVLFTNYYNEQPFSAFNTFVSFRDESTKRLEQIDDEITSQINIILDDIKKYDSPKSIIEKIKPLLNTQFSHPNLELYDEIENTVEQNTTENEYIRNRFPYVSMNDIDHLITISRNKRKIRILRGVVSYIIKSIVDYGFPLEINAALNQATIDAFTVEIPVEKPSKDVVYDWYADELRKADNDKGLAFKKLESLILERGFTLKDFKITTTDPESFYRSYTKWYKKTNSSSK